MRVFVTGGTTGQPKLVHRSEHQWQMAIAAKSEMFSDYGVGTNDKVAVFHPGPPWAIGQVFFEGALRVGATSMLLGLPGMRQEMRGLIEEFDPTVVCCTARVALRLSIEFESVQKSYQPRLVFAGGETLSKGTAHTLKQRFGADVVDVYGMAEFEMVGYQPVGLAGVFKLVRGLEYRVLNSVTGKTESLAPGKKGELALRRDNEECWHKTGDLIQVIEHSSSGNEENQFVSMIGRKSEVGSLCEGSQISAVQLKAVAEACKVSFVQAAIAHGADGDRVKLLVLCDDQGPKVEPQAVVEKLLSVNVDLADAYRDGAVRAVTAELVDESKLVRTLRGKLRHVVETEDGQ